MAVDLRKLQQTLLEWITEWNEGEFDGEITADTELFASGALDSMGFTGLIACLEDEAGIEFDFKNAEGSNDVSVSGLLAYCFPDELTT